MPTVGVYPAQDALDPGEELSSTYEGRHLTFLESELTHPTHTDGFVNKADPVVVGHIVGVAFTSAAAATDLVAIDTEGIWNLDVVAANDEGNDAVAAGDEIYINTTTAVLSKIASADTQVPFGYAIGVVTAGETGAIAVKVHWDPVDNMVLDDEPLFFGDGKDIVMQWDGTRFIVVPITDGGTVFQFGNANVAAQMKFHARNTTLGSAVEIRARTVSNTPALYGIDCITYLRPAVAMTSGTPAAAMFQTWLDSTYSMTDGYMFGIKAEVVNQGTMNGAGIVMAAVYAHVPNNSGTFTAVNIYTPMWLDWSEESTVTAGICTMMYISNNGTTPLTSILYINAGSTCTYLMVLNATGGIMTAAEVTADYTFTNYVTIRVLINGVVYYLIADRS